jgi:Ca2+-binding RTX toxin-like protein
LLFLAAGEALAGTVVGSGGGDVLRGSSAGERLVGFGGEDRIQGLAGDDELYGGGGDDELHGGQGSDVLLGGVGDDFAQTRDGGRDHVDCGPGHDAVRSDPRDRVARDCEMFYPG